MRPVISALAALLVLALGGFAVWRYVAPAPDAARKIARFAVDGESFAFDRAYLGPTREDGVVELAAFFPDFTPAGAGSADINLKTDLAERFRRTLFLELSPADPQLDPAERTARLYLRFLSEAGPSRDDGLVARAFEKGSPFQGDTLYFTLPEGRQFAARCRDAKAGLPATCAFGFRLDRVDVQVRFDASLLPQWQALASGARAFLEKGRQ